MTLHVFIAVENLVGILGVKVEIHWVIKELHKTNYQFFVNTNKEHPFVKKRINKNIERSGVEISKAAFWKALLGCFLSTRQRSGAGSRVDLFLKGNDQLLEHEFCQNTENLDIIAAKTLQSNGIRMNNRISQYIVQAANWLKDDTWKEIEPKLNSLLEHTDVMKERNIAQLLQEKLKGIGPKQSRNLIQEMGLSQYEIPIDSRALKVLKDLQFPVPLSSTALADEIYYCFIEDGIHQILSSISVIPCVFDACAFASIERDAH